jgi:hypothetical protein
VVASHGWWSFSRRSRFSSAVTSPSAAAVGSTARRSRRRPISGPASTALSPDHPASHAAFARWFPRRTASSSNSFVNRRCCTIEFLIPHRGTPHFSEASPNSKEPVTWVPEKDSHSSQLRTQRFVGGDDGEVGDRASRANPGGTAPAPTSETLRSEHKTACGGALS